MISSLFFEEHFLNQSNGINWNFSFKHVCYGMFIQKNTPVGTLPGNYTEPGRLPEPVLKVSVC